MPNTSAFQNEQHGLRMISLFIINDIPLPVNKAASMALAGRPSQGTAAKQVEMQVLDALPTILARVHHNSEPLVQLFLFRKPLDTGEDLPHEGLVFFLEMSNTGNVLFWNYQDMHRRSRVDIAKSDDPLVLKDNVRRDLSGGYPTEHAVVTQSATSFPEGLPDPDLDKDP